jgi:hypothetical protein
MKEKTNTSVRFTPDADAWLDALAERTGLSRTAVLELAVRELAIRWGVAPHPARELMGPPLLPLPSPAPRKK